MNSPAASGSPGAGQRRAQLPADVSGFVGRSGELARLARLLDAGRLVTVAGPGGVGKTRLALRAAADAAAPRDGSLPGRAVRPHRSGAAAGHGGAAPRPARADPAGRCAAVLGRPARPGAAADPRHLRAPDRRLRPLRHRGAARDRGVRILATSRQPLHVPGEEVLRLGPLPVPGPGPPPDAARGPGPAPGRDTGGDAVELFAQRAAAAVSGFTRHPGGPAARDQALPAARRHPARHRARRRPGAGAAGGRAGGAGRGRARGAAPAPGAASSAATRRCTRPSTGPTGCAPRPSGPPGGGCRCSPGPSTWRPRGTWWRRARRARRPGRRRCIGGLVDKSVVLPGGRGPLPAARLGPRVRRRAARRERRGRGTAASGTLARYLRLSSDFSHRLVSRRPAATG